MNQLQLASLSGLPADHSGVQQASPTQVFGALGRHRLTVALITLGLSLPAVFAIQQMKPYYTASSALLMGTRQTPFRDLQATTSGADIDMVVINTQVSILRSPAIATAVVKQLHLVDDPEFREALEHVPLKAKIMNTVFTITGHPPAPATPLTPAQRLQITAMMLTNKVNILNDGRSYIITITAKTADAASSARIANAYADVYLNFRRQMKVAATWRANSLLDDQIVPLRERLRKAEQAVEAFREQNGLISARMEQQPGPGGGGVDMSTVADQQLTQMNQELMVAQGILEEKRSRYMEVRDAARNGTLGSLPEVVAAPLVQQLQTQRAQLSSHVATLSQTYLDGNPELKAAQAAEAQVQRQIGTETARIADSVAKDVSAAQARVTALSRAVDALQHQVTSENQANVGLRQLVSEANAARAVYQDYLGRFAQTSTQAQLQEPEAELISHAETPLGISGPPRMQYMAIAVLFSLMLSTGAALVIDRIRNGIRSTSQLDSVPGLFTLGLVPALSGGLARHYRSGGTSSAYVETIEAIRSILCFGHSRFRAKVVLVTSASPGEGKTTFAVSLAANTGRDLQRALVIDCDTRNPSALAVVGKSDRPGDNTLPLNPGAGGLTRDVLPGVDILTLRPRNERNCAMVSPLELSRILAQFSPHYDMIILDTPPVLAFPDAAVLAQQTDGVVMVVKWGLTAPSALAEGMRILHAYDARVLGGVLTQVPSRGLEQSERRQLGIYSQYGLLTS
ncbi:polysaccharide biosynthesis tyrosine autokinase [Gluconacetobacter azotocaptans]|nr:polysaccharide biosynthesis tyrosine autokinase [Gluconacetobacter azotocaptans]